MAKGFRQDLRDVLQGKPSRYADLASTPRPVRSGAPTWSSAGAAAIAQGWWLGDERGVHDAPSTV
jgi:hypothetical protein